MSDEDFTVSVLGTRTLLDHLDTLEAHVLDQVFAVMEDAAVVGEQVMKANARVDTGEMRDSTYAEVRKDVPQAQMVFGDDAPWAIFNELGTIHMSAAPFIVPGGIAAGDYLKEHIQGLI